MNSSLLAILFVTVLCFALSSGRPQKDPHFYHKHNRDNRQGSVGYLSEANPNPRGSMVGRRSNVPATYKRDMNGDTYARKSYNGNSNFGKKRDDEQQYDGFMNARRSNRQNDYDYE